MQTNSSVFLGDQYYNKQHLNFILFKVLKADSLTAFDYFSEHDKDAIKMYLEATDQFAKEYLFPYLVEMDRKQPELINGRIQVHPIHKEIMRISGENGWISLLASKEVGGLQMPSVFSTAASFILGAANYSGCVFPGLTMGAAHLIEAFADKKYHSIYLPKMFAGQWQGTMALTEPGAGSSLSDVVSTAEKQDDGTYKIFGQKIFISCGDSDVVENVVHLLLARVKGAPAGTKGISMFIVPRERIDENGILQHNDVATIGVYHKMGYKGAPIAHLSFGENNNCIGCLVGEENKGLSYMFQMMNEARISVGLHATSIASASYYASLKYANERLQGRPIAEKNPEQPQVPIITHADVKRMLLFQKTFVEGALCLELQCSYYADMERVAEGDEKEKYNLLLEVLTPVAKSYPAEMSNLSTSTSLQIFGGYGFTKDFIAEQYYRETRIHAIHEGTTAIHGLDLLGRKVMLKNGKAVMLLMQEVICEINKAKQHDNTKQQAASLEIKLAKLQELSIHLMSVAQNEGIEAYLSDATLYLELFGILVMGWQWLKMANTCNENTSIDKEFSKSKILSFNYFYEYELPKTEALFIRLKSTNRVTVGMDSNLID
ncbi:MAG: acyl-CoA dehydrogenase [Chitinophagales bacterium]|nr:acyl-CoA dehydrogenase [Chitinophagales bacterium]MBP6155059.1 acyl-CoA dehydrogenase [Chitinophagales bacterium]